MLTMPVTVEIIGNGIRRADFQTVYNIFNQADRIFSTFRDDSEISRINRGEISIHQASPTLRYVLALAEATKKDTSGYFDIHRPDGLDPLGIVKGWMINEAAKELRRRGFKNFFIEVGGDIQADGLSEEGKKWQVGIRNPFNKEEIIKVVELSAFGIATSGTYERGRHIYNPKKDFDEANKIVSLTVIGSDVYEADRFATAAFAMGEKGIQFIEKLPDFEGYMINRNGVATLTTGWKKHEIH